MFYFKLLQTFLFSILLNKNDYDFNSSKFNPIRVATILIIVIYIGLTLMIFKKSNDSYVKSKLLCPEMYEEVKKEVKEEVKEEKKKSTTGE